MAEAHHEQAAPREQHVTAIHAAHTVISFFAHRRARQAVTKSANQMPQRMAAKGVARKQHKIREQHQRAHAHAKVAVEPERIPNVMREKNKKQQRQIKKVAMNILNDQRERTLPEILFP